MDKYIKIAFFILIVKPIVFIVLGLNIRNKEKLPTNGGAVIAANHNSHLDTFVILSLFPISKIHKIRPVAAADYFLKNKFMAFIALKCIGIIPFNRSGSVTQEELFRGCYEALENEDILILFPEGSRGKPEEMSRLKKGLFYLLKDKPEVPVIPIVMNGLGNALPKGEALFVPFNCKVNVGTALFTQDSSKEFNNELKLSFDNLFAQSEQ